MALPVLHDIGAVHMTKNNVIQDPQNGRYVRAERHGLRYGDCWSRHLQTA
jgi:hypothetical protein